MRNSGKIQSVVLYGKAGCCLCQEAREMLERLSQRLSLNVQEVDITSDPALYERYKHSIPVVAIGGRVVLAGHFNEDDLLLALQSAR